MTAPLAANLIQLVPEVTIVPEQAVPEQVVPELAVADFAVAVASVVERLGHAAAWSRTMFPRIRRR